MLATAALGGAVGSIASQGVAIAMGMQDSFSWKGVAMSAIGAGAASGVGAIANAGMTAQQIATTPVAWSQAALRAGGASVATQGVGSLLGISGFSWKAVAASAAGAGASSALGSTGWMNGLNSVAAGTVRGLVSGGIQAGIFGTRPNWGSIAAQSFGQALGDSFTQGKVLAEAQRVGDAVGGSLADEMQPSMTPQALRSAGLGLSDSATNADVMAYRMREAGFDGEMVATAGRAPAVNPGSMESLRGADGVYRVEISGTAADAPLTNAQRALLAAGAGPLTAEAAQARMAQAQGLADMLDGAFGGGRDASVSASPVTSTYVGDITTGAPYDEFGLFSMPGSQPIWNTVANPFAGSVGSIGPSMQEFKYGALESIRIDTELAAQRRDTSALYGNALKGAVIETMLPGSPQEVALGVGAGVVAGKLVEVASGALVSKFPVLGRSVGNVDAGTTIGRASLNLRYPVGTNPNEAFFWSGLTEGIGGEGVARQIAGSKSGTTLEALIEKRSIQIPKWDPINPDVVQAWKDISADYAKGSSGTVRGVIGQSLRPGNVWEASELPALRANPNVTQITTIDPVTKVETIIFKR